MPANPLTTAGVTIYMPKVEVQALRKLAAERRTSMQKLLLAQIEPLRKELRQRMDQRSRAQSTA